MGAFLLLKTANIRNSPENCAEIKKSLLKQGFTDTIEVEVPEYKLYLCRKQDADVANIFMLDDGDFCASVGTIIYRGKYGDSALRLIYKDRRSGLFSAKHAIGDYCLIVRVHGKTSIFIDKLGVYKVFHDPAMTVWSSSFLAISSLLQAPTVNSQAVYEYVFQEATYGNHTVYDGVLLVDPRVEHRVDTSEMSPVTCGYMDILNADSGVESTVPDNLEALRVIYSGIANCFQDNVDTALSGGYDSRLTFALLKEQGLRPRVHVYGKYSDPDVVVAKTIDESMRVGLKHTDKSQRSKLSRDEFSSVVLQNFHAFDGYPVGGIFSSDTDLETRKERTGKNRLALNGGGGEIYRNFFYLRSRDYSVGQFVRSFYNRFDPRMCTDRFSESAYFSNLQEKVLDTLNSKESRLTRRQIECLYPLFRCRYWMGRNNSINNRFGPAMTPFVEYGPVNSAMNIPLKEKNFGRFQARMISAVNMELASFTSAYGHNFVVEPGLKRRFAESLVLCRPPSLRKLTYRLKSRLSVAPKPFHLSTEYLEPLIGRDFPYMRQFFNVGEMTDWAQYNRMCTLEMLFQESQATVPVERPDHVSIV